MQGIADKQPRDPFRQLDQDALEIAGESHARLDVSIPSVRKV
jgi:hypothetical protein